MWVQSLGQENSLEKGMATHSSILAWRIPWTKEPEGKKLCHNHSARAVGPTDGIREFHKKFLIWTGTCCLPKHND